MNSLSLLPAPIPGSWDYKFLSNPNFKNWTEAQLQLVPILPGQDLVDYIRGRIAEDEQTRRRNLANGGPQPQGFPLVGNSYPTPAESGFSPTPSQGGSPMPYPYSSNASTSATLVPASSQPFGAHSPAAYSPQPNQSYFGHENQQPTSIDPSLMGSSSPALAMQRQLVLDEQARAYAELQRRSSLPQQPQFSPTQHMYLLQQQQQITASRQNLQPQQPPLSIQPSQLQSIQPSQTLNHNQLPRLPPNANASNPPPIPTLTTIPTAAAALLNSHPRVAPLPQPAFIPTPPTPVPETPWTRILPTLHDLLSPTRFHRASTSTASKLSQIISSFAVTPPQVSAWDDSSDVPPVGRREVVEGMLALGGEEFWKSWLDLGRLGGGKKEVNGMDVVVAWFGTAVVAMLGSEKEVKKEKEGKKKVEIVVGEEDKAVLRKSLAGLVKLLAKLPLTYESLLKYKIAAKVKKISSSDKITDLETKRIANELVTNWSKWQAAASAKTAVSKEDVKPDVKRKSVESSDAPKKKAKVTVVPVTKTTVKTSSTVAPKAKLPGPLFKATALPSFKKEKKPEVIPAGPGSDLDPFQAALNALGPTAGGSSKPVMKTDGAVLVPVPSSLVRGGGKDKKIKKRVSFASEEKLVMIKIIERAVYDDFDSEGGTSIEHVREMEEQEGLTHTMHLDEEMEEEIDWYEPIETVLPAGDEFTSFKTPPDSAEIATQTAREATTPEFIIDPLADDYPSTPIEALSIEEEPDSPTVIIPLSPELTNDERVQAEIAAAQSGAPKAGAFAANDQISNLLSQLNPSAMEQVLQQQQLPQQAMSWNPTPQHNHVTMPDEAAIAQLSNFDPALIQSVLAQQPELSLKLAGIFGLQSSSAAQNQATIAQDFGRPTDNGWGTAPVVNWNASASSAGWEPLQQPSLAGKSKRGAALKGKRGKQQVCRFFASRKGCDWGEKCHNLHCDDGTGVDVRGP